MSQVKLVLPRGRRRVDRAARMLRATWRDTSALWREFRRPILAFIIATLGGGWLYGELLVIAGYPRLPFVDLPYLMISLMVVETVTDMPPEPYLIIFWYLMPLIAIYIVGRGAADFIRLFFNRSERRSAWEEAIVSTYRNHIIVLGVGHIGLRVIRTLAQMGFDVVAVDLHRTDEFDSELAGQRVPLIIGDGRSPSVLESAGLLHAESLIVCTSDDFLNLEVCVRARDMNKHIRIVVRMWDDQFANHLKTSLDAETVSASDLAAPVFAGMAVGVDIAPSFHIQNTDYSLIRLQVQPGSFLDGRKIRDLQHENDMDIVLHERNSQVDVHPTGDQDVRAGDNLVIFARHTQITELVARNARKGAR